MQSAMSYSSLRIDDDDFVPVRQSSVERPRRSNSLPFVPLLLIDGFSSKSFTYSALPQEPLRLSVLKLDGSCFDIQVAKTATIGELKLAVEAVFSHMPQKGPGKISWPHVWGHFCLCFGGQKLLVETHHIRSYGIKDGDQLHFVRHISISYTMTKKRSNKGFNSPEVSSMSISQVTSFEDLEATEEDEEQHGKEVQENEEVFYDSDDIENPKSPHSSGGLCIERSDTLPSLLGEWFPYYKLSPTGTPKRGIACAPRIATGLLVGFRKIFGLCFEKRDKCYSRRDTWRID